MLVASCVTGWYDQEDSSDVAVKYAFMNKLDIAAAQEAFNSERATEAKSVRTGRANRRDMSIIVGEMLGNAKLSGPNITMTVYEFKILVHTVTFLGDSFDVMFAALRGMCTRLVDDGITAFDGIFL